MNHSNYTAILASTALLAISAVRAADSPAIDTPVAPPSSITQDYSYYCTALHNNYSTLYISGVSKETWPWQRGFIESTVNPAWTKTVQTSYQYLYNPSCVEGPSATMRERRQQQVDQASRHGQRVVEIDWHY